MSSNDALILTWFGVVSLIGLNGFAAGTAAMMSSASRRISRWGRIVFSVLMAGMLPASAVILVLLVPAEFGLGEELRNPLPVFGTLLVIGAAVSLPGAWLITRKLEKPGEEFHAFE